MPELPDITVYVESLESRIAGATLKNIRLNNPFLLRTATPPIASAEGRRVTGVRRMGKRIVISLDGDFHLVIHLMVAGRLKWLPAGAKPPGKSALAVFEFDAGSLVFTEAGTKRRASLHFMAGITAVEALHAGGIEVLGVDLEAFARRLRAENHTLKRALTDPHIFSGVGNAYSDEILHDARMSPARLTQKMTPEEFARLHASVERVLNLWADKLRSELGSDGFPEQVTAFREGMAVHGRYGQPCPVCGAKVQRIAYADHETNYCANCQTGGKLLADRSLSRLLRDDWPKTLAELEERSAQRK